MMYRMPPVIIAGLKGVDLAAQNIPSEADYVATYAKRTGRAGIANLEFYVAFNLFRLPPSFTVSAVGSRAAPPPRPRPPKWRGISRP